MLYLGHAEATRPAGTTWINVHERLSTNHYYDKSFTSIDAARNRFRLNIGAAIAGAALSLGMLLVDGAAKQGLADVQIPGTTICFVGSHPVQDYFVASGLVGIAAATGVAGAGISTLQGLRAITRLHAVGKLR